MQKEYNKAIRDKIPEIMKKNGKSSTVKKLEDPEFLVALESKLTEELHEYYESHSIEELADMLEVIFRIAELKGTSQEQLDQIRLRKSKERGGFAKNLFLVIGEI